MFRSGNFLWQRKFEKVPVKKQIFGNKCILKIVELLLEKFSLFIFIANIYNMFIDFKICFWLNK